jgi:hypothetical protein
MHFIYAIDAPQRKTFTMGGSFKPIQKPAKANTYWISGHDNGVNSLEGLLAAIKKRMGSKTAEFFAVMRGVWRPSGELWSLEEQRKAHITEMGKQRKDVPASQMVPYVKNGEKREHYLRRKGLILDLPINWVCFDFDGLQIEGMGDFDVANPVPWAQKAIELELGPDFACADYVLQLSSSAGLKPGISAHCWFWLEKPMDGAAWRAWYARRTRELGRKPRIDKTLFERERIHYIATPKFDGGTVDPVAEVEQDRYISVENFDNQVYLKDVEGLHTEAQVEREEVKVDFSDESERAQEAFDRPGVIGAFNRCFSMSDCINRFLYDHYRIDTSDGRVTWLKSDSGAAGGCRIVAGNTRMFSTHNGDPLERYVGTAFDHIQAVLFDNDYTSTAEWARTLPEVAAEMERVEMGVFDDEVPLESFKAEVALATPDGAESVKVETPEDVMAEYPMPKKWHGQAASYRLADGVWWYGYEKAEEEDEEGSKKKKKKGGGPFVSLWTPITFVREFVSANSGEITTEYKLRDKWGKPVSVMIEKGRVVSAPTDVLARLHSLGWLFEINADKAFLHYMRVKSPDVIYSSLDNRGWDKRGVAFAVPSGAIYGASDAILRPDLVVGEKVSRGGSLEGWRGVVDGVLDLEGCAHWALAVAAGFAGPLVGLLNLPTSGLALCGETSKGKTTALKLAVSAWTSPDPQANRDGGLLVSLRGTSNSVDVLAENANHTILALDETAMMQAKDLESLVFSVTSGAGKARMNITGQGLRKSSVWQTFVLISGEQGLAQRFEDATGKKMAKGAAARLLDVDVDALDVVVTDVEALRRLEAGVLENFGWAGPAFVEGLVKGGFVDRVGELQARLGQHELRLGENRTGLVSRVARVAALLALAAELAEEFGILSVGSAERISNAILAVWGAFEESAAANSEEAIVDEIRQWIAARLNMSIFAVDDTSRHSVEADGWHDGETIYILANRVTKASKGANTKTNVAKALYAAGVLRRQWSDRNPSTYIRGRSEKLAHYRIDAKALGIVLDPEFEVGPSTPE